MVMCLGKIIYSFLVLVLVHKIKLSISTSYRAVRTNMINVWSPGLYLYIYHSKLIVRVKEIKIRVMVCSVLTPCLCPLSDAPFLCIIQ